MRPLPPLLVVIALVVAGCAETKSVDDPVDPDPPAAAIDFSQYPVDFDHNHADPALHAVGQGVERLGFLGAPSRGYNLAGAGDIMLVSLENQAGGGALGPGMGLWVLNISDPKAPKSQGQMRVPSGGVEAVAITPDAKFGFLGGEFSGSVGVWVVDLRGATPQIAGFTPIEPEGPHNVRYANVDGRDLILASISHVSTGGSVATGSQDPIPVYDLRVDILEFEPDAPEQRMTTLSSYMAQDELGIQPGTPIVHDAVAQVHPITGQSLMYVAHWDRGVRIVDIGDPEAPVEIGVYADPLPTDFLIIHTVKPHPGLIGGRHYTVATSQCSYAAASECHLRILDTTDPATPVQVATWTLPETIHGVGHTTEIFDLADSKVWAPWGHGGLWVLDISVPTEPVAQAYYFPSEASIGTVSYAPFVNAAYMHGNVTWIVDTATGVHALRTL